MSTATPMFQGQKSYGAIEDTLGWNGKVGIQMADVFGKRKSQLLDKEAEPFQMILPCFQNKKHIPTKFKTLICDWNL